MNFYYTFQKNPYLYKKNEKIPLALFLFVVAAFGRSNSEFFYPSKHPDLVCKFSKTQFQSPQLDFWSRLDLALSIDGLEFVFGFTKKIQIQKNRFICFWNPIVLEFLLEFFVFWREKNRLGFGGY